MDKIETVTEEQKKFAIDAIVTLVVDEISLETGEDSMVILPKFIESKTAETLYDESSNLRKGKMVKIRLQGTTNEILSQEKFDITCEGITKSSTKMEFYKFLRHNLGDKDDRLIYGAVCDSWGELVVMAS